MFNFKFTIWITDYISFVFLLRRKFFGGSSSIKSKIAYDFTKETGEFYKSNPLIYMALDCSSVFLVLFLFTLIHQTDISLTKRFARTRHILGAAIMFIKR